MGQWAVRPFLLGFNDYTTQFSWDHPGLLLWFQGNYWQVMLLFIFKNILQKINVVLILRKKLSIFLFWLLSWKVLPSLWTLLGTSGLVSSVHLGFQRKSSLAERVFFFCFQLWYTKLSWGTGAHISGNLPRMGKKEVACGGVRQSTRRIKQVTTTKNYSATC